MAVLGQVTIPQGLHSLSVLFLILHVACRRGKALRAGCGPGWVPGPRPQAGSLTEAGAVDGAHGLLDPLQDSLVSFQDLEATCTRFSGAK